MSTIVYIDSILLEQRKKMLTDLKVSEILKKGKQKYPTSHSFDVYEVLDDDLVCIPFAYYYQHLAASFPNKDKIFENIDATFNILLFDRQKEIRDESLKILNETRSIVLSLFTGWGKTMFAIYLACKIKLKTVIFAHRIIIIDQWKTSIIKACGEDVKIQIVTSNCEIDPDANFYIINVSNVPKRDRSDFSHCGVLIADECHTLCTEKFSKTFNYVSPKYVIGLTATPVRSDGKDRVIELFCGPNIIYKPLNALFNVYLYQTKFTPVLKKTEAGGLDWNSVLMSQSMSKRRNEILIDIIRYFSRRHILVACKRKDHAKILMEGLKKYGEDVDCYMGSDKIVNYDCRILIVTYSKGGCGFDAPKLDMLLVAGDIEEQFLQCLGRVFRREWHFPIIIDPIDKMYTLKKHSETRCEIYKDAGGEVKNLVNYFPHFEAWRERFATDLTDFYERLKMIYVS